MKSPILLITLWFNWLIIRQMLGFRLAVNQQRLGLAGDDRLVDHHFVYAVHRRQIVHGVEQRAFHDGTQAAGAGFARHGFLGDGVQRFVAELQLYAFGLNNA